MTDKPHRPVALFFGSLLMAVGGLIAVTAGLCSLVVGVLNFADALKDPNGVLSVVAAELPFLLAVGGIPFAIGVGLFVGGWALWRGPRVRH